MFGVTHVIFIKWWKYITIFITSPLLFQYIKEYVSKNIYLLKFSRSKLFVIVEKTNCFLIFNTKFKTMK